MRRKKGAVSWVTDCESEKTFAVVKRSTRRLTLHTVASVPSPPPPPIRTIPHAPHSTHTIPLPNPPPRAPPTPLYIIYHTIYIYNDPTHRDAFLLLYPGVMNCFSRLLVAGSGWCESSEWGTSGSVIQLVTTGGEEDRRK